MIFPDHLGIKISVVGLTLVLTLVPPAKDAAGRQVGTGTPASSKDGKGETISGRVVDRLGRPVSGVRVEAISPTRDQFEPPVVVTTGDDGQFWYHATGKRNEQWLNLAKPGYTEVSSVFRTAERKEFMLPRELDLSEFSLLEVKEGPELDRQMREFLATDERMGELEDSRLRYLFKHQASFRPSLRRLVGDAHIGDDAREILDLWGDPGDRDLFLKGRRYTPKHEIREDDLVEAIKAIARRLNWFSDRPEPKITINYLVFDPEMNRVLVQCGINLAPFTGVFWRFSFHKDGKQWVLRSMQETGRG